MTLAPVVAPPRHLAMVARQLDYWLTVYRRTWRGSVVSSFLMPLLYLAAMGWLLGGYVDASTPALDGAPSYLLFVAPGLLASHAMQIAMGEVLWPVMGMIKWNKTYFGMIASPLRVVDVFGAHMAFVLFRVGLACLVFMLALAPFGPYATLPGAIGAFLVQLLIGLAFATPFYAVAARAESDSVFSVIFRVVVTPLFLFSGAFFPVSQLPPVLRVLAQCSPLYQGVELTRDLMLRPVSDIDPAAAALHVGYLALLALLGGLWALRRLQGRLIA